MESSSLAFLRLRLRPFRRQSACVKQSDKGPTLRQSASGIMADLSDVELVAELKSYGENVSLPIKEKNRPILVKKLNHLRVRHKKEDLASKKTNSRPASNRNSRGRSSPTPTPPALSPSRLVPNRKPRP